MTGWRSFPPYDKGSREATIRYNDALRDLAREQGALLADVWAAQGEADWLIHPDGVHANRVGNLIIAHAIFAELCRHCPRLTRSTHAADEATDWTRMTTQARRDAGDPFRNTWTN